VRAHPHAFLMMYKFASTQETNCSTSAGHTYMHTHTVHVVHTVLPRAYISIGVLPHRTKIPKHDIV
jgi:hypothetical protein